MSTIGGTSLFGKDNNINANGVIKNITDTADPTKAIAFLLSSMATNTLLTIKSLQTAAGIIVTIPNLTFADTFAFLGLGGQTQTFSGALIMNGNTNVTAQFKASGSLALSVASLSTTQSLTSSSKTILIVDATAGAITLTLPAANVYGAGITPKFIIVKKDSSANAVTIARAGADTISQGASTGLTSISLATQGKSVFLVGDSVSIWYDMGGGWV